VFIHNGDNSLTFLRNYDLPVPGSPISITLISPLILLDPSKQTSLPPNYYNNNPSLIVSCPKILGAKLLVNNLIKSYLWDIYLNFSISEGKNIVLL
jgi:hypothetical protein